MSPEARPKVAVILVHYGEYALKFFKDCHQSLERQSPSAAEVVFYAVDNGASPESARFVKELAPGYRHLDNGGNKGWASGNNLAVRAALDEGADYLVFLNMDTVLDEDWLKNLVRAALDGAGTHIFQSKILLRGTDRINSVGNRINYLGYGYCLGYGKPEGSEGAEGPMDFASGASMLVKSAVFRSIGPFRERYFMYYDDMEFCWRARLAGFAVGLAPASVCRHDYDFRAKFHWLYELERNRLLTLFTLLKVPTLLLIAPVLLLNQIIGVLYFLFKGYGFPQAHAALYFLSPGCWKWIRQSRREVRRLRVKKDREIFGGFSGKIVFAEVRSRTLRWLANPFLRAYWSVIRSVIVW